MIHGNQMSLYSNRVVESASVVSVFDALAPKSTVLARVLAIVIWLRSIWRCAICRSPDSMRLLPRSVLASFLLASCSRWPLVLAADFHEALTPPLYPLGNQPRCLQRIGSSMLRHGAIVTAVTFSPDGRLIAAGDLGGGVCIWDALTGQLVADLKGHQEGIVALCFSPKGTYLATGDSKALTSTAIIWDTATWQQVRVLSNSIYWLSSLGFSRSEELVFTGGGNAPYGIQAPGLNRYKQGQTLRCWNVITGKEQPSVTERSDYVRSFAVSPTRDHIALPGKSTISNLDTNSRMEIETIDAKGIEESKTISYSHNGLFLAWFGDNGVNVYDIAKKKVVGLVQPRQSGSHPLAFSPSDAGRLLLEGEAQFRVGD